MSRIDFGRCLLENVEELLLSMFLGVCAVWSVRFFLKFITEPIEIGFLIIKIDAYRLGSGFRHIAVRFFAVGLVGLVTFFLDNINTKLKLKTTSQIIFDNQPAIHKNIFQLILIQIILN